MLESVTDPGPVDIVTAAVDDWQRVRDIRLRALEDAPFAFGSRLEEEQARSASFWRARLGRPAAATLLALAEGAAIGLVSVFLMPDDPAHAHLVSMWVAPDARGRGVGQRLVEQAVGWARDHGADRIDLWVTEANGPARRLYASCGFEPTGGRQPLPSHPSVNEFEMQRRLDAPSGRSRV